MTETTIIILLVLSFALRDGLHDRGKNKPRSILGFNIWLEISKLTRLIPAAIIIYLMGFEWRLVGIFLILSYVLFMPVYNLASGRNILYLGTGLYDTLVKGLIGNIWTYLASLAASIVIWWNLKSKKRYEQP